MAGPNNEASTSTTAGTVTGTRSSQNVRLNTTQPMPTRKMPKPGEKNAPTFDPEKPEELGRFFERMADWFADESIDDDDDQKRRIVRYLDPDSEAQWKALSKFVEGTFEEFKSQVMSSYPKAEEVMKGSVTALKRKIRGIGPVSPVDRDELLNLIRVMTAEVLKLKLIQPPIHTNRELVELFLARLMKYFAGRIANKLSVQRIVAQGQGVALVARNTEDMYDIDEVMQIAKETSLEYANPFGKYLEVATGGTSDTNVKLEEAVARLTDTINLQVQHNKQVDQRLANMQSFMNQPRLPAAQPGFNRGLTPPQNHVAANFHCKCFYCHEAHRVADCEHALKHLDMKWIIKSNGLLRLPDGSPIPRDGVKTMKEVVESMSKMKAGLIPMSKIQDKAALYQESAMLSPYAPQPTSDEDNVRALAELIQKVGLDRVQAMINPSSQEIKEEVVDEWNQNFD